MTLRLEGRIAADWVGVLAAECQRRLERGEAVRLDLVDVVSSDSNGRRQLRELRDRGVTLVNAPPFLAGRLDAWDPR